MTRIFRSLFAAAALLFSAQVQAAQAAPPAAADGLGNVHFASSCSANVAPGVDRGFALLYSFWYDRALDAFNDVVAHDANCAIAYWGAAMTFNHPLWGPPTGTDLREGIAFLKRSSAATERSPRESA